MADPPADPDADFDAVDDTDEGPDHGSTTGAPRWVKVTGIIVGVLILTFVVLQFVGPDGGHGPGRHGDVGEVTPGGEDRPVGEDAPFGDLEGQDHEDFAEFFEDLHG